MLFLLHYVHQQKSVALQMTALPEADVADLPDDDAEIPPDPAAAHGGDISDDDDVTARAREELGLPSLTRPLTRAQAQKQRNGVDAAQMTSAGNVPSSGA